MHEQQLIKCLNKDLVIEMAPTTGLEQICQAVKHRVNELLQTDFHALVTLLYRIDVNEKKLKQLLENSQDADAADIISTLIVERQLQKIKSRETFRNDERMSDEEKW